MLVFSVILCLFWFVYYCLDIYYCVLIVIMISDWMVFMLSGELVVDFFNVGMMGLLDLVICNWKCSLL